MFLLIDDSFYDDKDIALQGVKYNGDYLRLLSDRLKDDEAVVLVAVKDGIIPNAFKHASERLQNDKIFVLRAMKENRRSFQFAGKELRSDKKLKLIAQIKDNRTQAIEVDKLIQQLQKKSTGKRFSWFSRKKGEGSSSKSQPSPSSAP